MFVFDAGYDPIALTVDRADLPVAILARIRCDRVFYAAPTPVRGQAGAPAPARRPLPLRGPGQLAGSGSDAAGQRRAVRPGADGLLGWAASQAGRAWPLERLRHPADRDRHGHPGAGRAPAPAHRPGGQDAVAVVGRPRPTGLGPVLAGLHPPLRPRAHLPFLQAGPGLDHSAGTHPRAGRPLDLAGAHRLHPAPSGPLHRRRHAVALGTAPAGTPADPDPNPTRFPAAPTAAGHAGQPTETLRPLTRTTDRQPTRTSTPPASNQE